MVHKIRAGINEKILILKAELPKEFRHLKKKFERLKNFTQQGFG